MSGGSANVLAGWENVIAPPQQQVQTPAQPHQDTGLKGLLENFLPTIGGTVGAIGGSLLGPLGTAGGGAAGSGLGEFLKEKLSGQKTNFGNIAKQSAIGALPGAVEGLSGGIAGARAGEGFLSGLVKGKAAIGVTQAATQAATEGATNGLGGEALNGVEQIAGKGAQAGAKVRSAAQEADAAASGFGVGTPINGGPLTPDRANELYDFARNDSAKYAPGGIKPGSPLSQSQQAQDVFNGVKSQLASKVDEINRPLIAGEAENVANNAIAKAADNGMVTGKTPILDKAVQKITALEENGDVKGLEDIRKEYDTIAYTKAGAGKTSGAAQARAVRDSIDEFLHGAPGETPRLTDYKDIKSDYSKARDLLELTSKGVKSADTSIGGGKGLFGAITGSPLAKGAKSAVASRLAGNNTVRVGNFLGALTKQGIAHSVGGAFLDPQTQPTSQATNGTIPPGWDATTYANFKAANPSLEPTAEDTAQMLGTGSSAPTDTSPFSTTNIQDSVKSIIAQGGTMKDVTDYLAAAKGYNDLTASPSLSTAQQKVVDNANQASDLLDTVYQQYNDAGGGQGRAGGGVENILGKVGLNSKANAYNQTLKDSAIQLAQALSGSTRIPSSEQLQAIIQSMPNLSDNPEEAATKVNSLKQLLSNRVQTAKSNS